MIQLRDYQIDLSALTVDLLQTKGIAYLTMQVRTGKTLTALNAANDFGAKKVLFLTKLKAIKSIQDDYNALQPYFEIVIINNESIHKVIESDFDLIISDEHHRNSAFPKPNKTAKIIKERFGHLPMIFLSGTPAIESGSQWFHSFWVSKYSPFRNYRNFYGWAKEFTNKKTRYFGTIQVPDYSDSIDEKIMPYIEPYLLKYTQQEAGFESEITEHVLYCEMSETTNRLVKQLLKDNVIQGIKESIVADTPVKLMSKIHQISNGTCIFESGNSIILDKSKADFIRFTFAGQKIAIFFNTTEKNIALQQVAGSEGISLKLAQSLVYYSFGYSGKNFVQGRDRMTTIERQENNVFFVMQKGDFNEKIYKVVKDKKRYSEKLFIKDYYGRGTRNTGHPDLFCAKNGRLILIEVKAKGKVPDPLQEYRIKEWNKNGFTAFYADSFESFLSQWAKTCF